MASNYDHPLDLRKNDVENESYQHRTMIVQKSLSPISLVISQSLLNETEEDAHRRQSIDMCPRSDATKHSLINIVGMIKPDPDMHFEQNESAVPEYYEKGESFETTIDNDSLLCQFIETFQRNSSSAYFVVGTARIIKPDPNFQLDTHKTAATEFLKDSEDKEATHICKTQSQFNFSVSSAKNANEIILLHPNIQSGLKEISDPELLEYANFDTNTIVKPYSADLDRKRRRPKNNTVSQRCNPYKKPKNELSNEIVKTYSVNPYWQRGGPKNNTVSQRPNPNHAKTDLCNLIVLPYYANRNKQRRRPRNDALSQRSNQAQPDPSNAIVLPYSANQLPQSRRPKKKKVSQISNLNKANKELSKKENLKPRN